MGSTFRVQLRERYQVCRPFRSSVFAVMVPPWTPSIVTHLPEELFEHILWYACHYGSALPLRRRTKTTISLFGQVCVATGPGCPDADCSARSCCALRQNLNNSRHSLLPVSSEAWSPSRISLYHCKSSWTTKIDHGCTKRLSQSPTSCVVASIFLSLSLGPALSPRRRVGERYILLSRAHSLDLPCRYLSSASTRFTFLTAVRSSASSRRSHLSATWISLTSPGVYIHLRTTFSLHPSVGV